MAGFSETKEHDSWKRISVHITQKFGYFRSPLTCFRHWKVLKGCSKTKIVPGDRTNSVEQVGGPTANSSGPATEEFAEAGDEFSGSPPAHMSAIAPDGDRYMNDGDQDEEGDPVFTEMIDDVEEEKPSLDETEI